VKILGAELQRIELRLRRPLATASGTHDRRPGLLLHLRGEDGTRGHGEATPLPHFGTESLEAAKAGLRAVCSKLPGRELEEPGANLEELAASCGLGPCARWALDCALHDLVARQRGVPITALLGGRRPPQSLAASALLFGASPEALVDSARKAREQGFRTVKLKLGSPDFARDRVRVAAVRNTLGAEVAIRLDANGAWSLDQATERIRALSEFEPELVEQPLPALQLRQLAELRRRVCVPIAADESVGGREDLQRVLEAGAANVVVLKPARLGGLRRSVELGREARRAGMEVVVTSLLDGAVSLAGALQVAASLGEGPLACGLATSALLLRDVARPPRVALGRIWLPRPAGLGVAPPP